MTSEHFELVCSKAVHLATKAAEEGVATAVTEANNIGKSQLTITIKLATMGGDMSIKPKWATKASKTDGDELPEETVIDQPGLGL